MKLVKSIKASLVLASVALLIPGAIHAQEYPTKPVTVIVPYAAGGSTDVLGRVLAEAMTRELKQQVLVENVGGAGGTVGAARVAKAQPDGYTLMFHNMAQAVSSALYPTLRYNPVSDFEPLGLVADVPMILVARKGLPAANLQELVAMARAQKGKLTIAHSGPGSTAQLCAMQLMQALNVEFTQIPYRGTGPALQDLVGGQVDLLCDQPVATGSHLKVGSIKAIALASSTRLSILPDVPTFAEAGRPGFELAVWHGLYAPKGTPEKVKSVLVNALQKGLRDPRVKERYATLGAKPVDVDNATPDALSKHLNAEEKRWRPLIVNAGLKGN